MISSRETQFKDHFSGLAKSENIFVQMGLSNHSFGEFFVRVSDIAKFMDFRRTDIVLDAGGGAGWMSIAFSSFVDHIFLFDYTEALIEKAKENIVHFSNITAYVDDLGTLNKTRDILKTNKVDKVIVGSILQYFSDLEKVETVFQNLFGVLNDGGKAIFTLNPDLQKKQAHIKSYDRLDWSDERKTTALENEEKRLWLDRKSVTSIAKRAGFNRYYETPIDSSLWQSTHMFNFVLEK